ncbi:DUF1772 domain-containing protein [Psychroserpens sp.]|uniref:anthrone oxygenase family protein n=1 Tax=Psychroserpens sp. TaxID=2020870 RepID=UPI001B050502|nr:DUF1772 domain-containing protein [Psychroserpens sp.]MBO6607194.1 DUF1772 domain-containing protein [Psychroserpens sp.]MBO6630774.1 DUF1772 domain-containing protein [Psychroserpens sp.]MBO6654340.1 DUF1772 domain-containing protein [Psychroserpens sp.]MBO6682374.1 DUF1772 domain-containing protein [Psychroserpens sp.]MBO6750966.1 DUF1772 domain-containing protein [Psychroserpens sp.]
MEINLEAIVVYISILFTGLTAGLCFTWTNAVTPGLGQLNDLGYLQAFQQMNRSIINPLFILVFFGPLISHGLTIYLKFQNADNVFWIYVAAAALFILGVLFVTIFKNVPLNTILDGTDLANISSEDLKALRQKFETPWNQWHLVRTVCSIASFALLLYGLLLNNQTI